MEKHYKNIDMKVIVGGYTSTNQLTCHSLTIYEANGGYQSTAVCIFRNLDLLESLTFDSPEAAEMSESPNFGNFDYFIESVSSKERKWKIKGVQEVISKEDGLGHRFELSEEI